MTQEQALWQQQIPSSKQVQTLKALGSGKKREMLKSIEAQGANKNSSLPNDNSLLTIFRIGASMLNLSNILTTIAGVVRKNKTMNSMILIVTAFKYQYFEGIDRFSLQRKIKL